MADDESVGFKGKLDAGLAVLNHHNRRGLTAMDALAGGLHSLYDDTIKDDLPDDLVQLLAKLDSH